MEDVSEGKVVEFTNIIGELLNEFQDIVPKLSEEDISAIKKLLNKFVEYDVIMNGNGYHTSLSTLLYFAIPKKGKDYRDTHPSMLNGALMYLGEVYNLFLSNEFLQNYDYKKAEEYLPKLSLLVTHDFLGIKDYKGNTLYSTDHELYPVSNTYELKSESEARKLKLHI